MNITDENPIRDKKLFRWFLTDETLGQGES
jgi:hypothetical protein